MSVRILVTGASLTVSLGLPISDARAQYYIGAQAGWTELPYQTDTIDGLAPVPVQFNAGYNVGIRGGYRWGPWRFEEEYSYRHNNTAEYGVVGDSTNGVSGNRHTHSIMTNVLYALSHQVKRCLQVLPSLFTSLALRERRVRFPWSGVDKALFRMAACRVCRLLPAPFDGMLDDRTIVGLA